MKLRTEAIIFTLIFATSIAQNATQDSSKGKPQVTRTSLHVSRSLDPVDTELLNVRSKTGEVATLIVKRREGRRTPTVAPELANKSKIQDILRPKIQDAPNLIRAAKSQAVPNPVSIQSDMIAVKDDVSRKKKGRNLQTVGEDGIPVVEGIRMPDSPEDKKQTWRNARVINGVLVPYKQSLTREIPLKDRDTGKKASDKKEVTVSSYFETTENENSMFGDDDEIKNQWKGIAETVLAPSRTEVKPIPFENLSVDGAAKDKLVSRIYKINQKEVENRKKTGRSLDFDADRRMDENVDENEEPIWVDSSPKEIWTDEGKIAVADRRMDDEPEEKEKFQPIARLLHPQGSSNYPVSSMYSSQPSRLSFEEGVRTPVLQYAHPELGAQPVKVETAAVPKEPVSTTERPQTPPLVYFSNDPYADRSPYAYEPGLSDDTLSMNSNFHAPEVPNTLKGSSERESRRHANIANIHTIELTTSPSEKSSINPDEIDITESPNRAYINEDYHDSYGIGQDKYIKRYPYPGYYSNNYAGTKDDYYKYKIYGNNYNGAYYIKLPDNRPLWEKITDSIKETVQNGVETVKDMTRPVVEPLFEATQRISENLGINDATAKISSTLGLNQGTGMRTAIQEKMGSAASAPVLFPAIGLLAGGAALGLGAVAVGRLFDVNVNLLRRSEDGEIDVSALQMEHKRALESIKDLPESLKESAGNMLILPVAANGQVANNDEVMLVTDGKYQMKPEEQRVVLIPINREAKFLPMNEKKTNGAHVLGSGNFKKLIDESGVEGLERFHFNVNEESDNNHKPRRRAMSGMPQERLLRRRRSVVETLSRNYPSADH